MLNCDQTLELLSARLDGPLGPEDAAALEEHLSVCPACRALADDLAVLHDELPLLAAQPPARLKEDVMEQIHASKVTPFQSKKRQWRWQSLASLAAVAALVVAGYTAMSRLSDGALTSGTAGVAVTQPAAGEEAGSVARANIEPYAVGGDIAIGESPEATPLPTPPAGAITQAEAALALARYLGWPEDLLTGDSSGTLTGPTDADGTTRTITCVGLAADGSGWLCQLEEITPGPDGVASCTSYTVSFDGTVIAP